MVGLSCLTAVLSPSGLGVLCAAGSPPVAVPVGGRCVGLALVIQRKGRRAACGGPKTGAGDQRRRPVGAGLPVGTLAGCVPVRSGPASSQSGMKISLKKTYKD